MPDLRPISITMESVESVVQISKAQQADEVPRSRSMAQWGALRGERAYCSRRAQQLRLQWH